MLLRIEISDFALIDEAILQPESGLTILTGETGAGKSILVDAISVLCGRRASRDLVRHGRPKASITAIFDSVQNLIPADLCQQLGLEDEELIVSREISDTGRSVARIAGRIVPTSLLRDLMTYLIDIHGQHDHQAIFKKETHLSLLDRFGQEAIAAAKKPYQEALRDYRDNRKRLQKLGDDPAKREQELDMLRYQVQEIDAAAIENEAEDETLTARRRVLSHADKIREALTEAHERLSGDQPYAILQSLGIVSENVAQSAEQAPALEETGGQIEEALILLQSAAMELYDFIESVEADPQELARVDERLDMLFRLKRKYGGDLGKVLAHREQASQRHSDLADGQELYDALLQKQQKLEDTLREDAAKLSRQRQKVARMLEKDIAGQLADLGMPKVRFSVAMETMSLGEKGFASSGQDQVQFLFSANPGEPLKPLSQIASGGEASRIMLAIKVILAHADRIPVLIFDEIDSGISGHTADKVAEKLFRLSQDRQVLCITHLAQIAAMADTHVLIAKESDEKETQTRLQLLHGEGKAAELGRLLSGGTGQKEALQLARQMLDRAAEGRHRLP